MDTIKEFYKNNRERRNKTIDLLLSRDKRRKGRGLRRYIVDDQRLEKIKRDFFNALV